MHRLISSSVLLVVDPQRHPISLEQLSEGGSVRDDEPPEVKRDVTNPILDSSSFAILRWHRVLAHSEQEEKRDRGEVGNRLPRGSARGTPRNRLQMLDYGDGDCELWFRRRILPPVRFEEAAELKDSLAAAMDFRGVWSSSQLDGLANGTESAFH